MARLSRPEMARIRADVKLTFLAPNDSQMRDLVAACERIHGRLPSTGQQNYLIRCFRVHGPQTADLMERLYAERGTSENLLLAVEVHPAALPDGPPADDATDVFTPAT